MQGRNERPTGVVFVGQFYNQGGYASLCHNYVDAIVGAGIPCRVEVFGTEIPEVRAEWEPVVRATQDVSVGENPVVVICDIPTRFRLVSTRNVVKKIGITIFETDRIPSGWADHCNTMDEIWVPSDFNVGTFTKHGVKHSIVRKMPIGIPCESYCHAPCTDPAARSALLPGAALDKFVFLYLFGLHYRKGFDVLLRAYLEEFTRDDDVFLFMSCFPVQSGVRARFEQESFGVKSFVWDQVKGSLVEGGERRLPPFEIVERWWSNEELLALYRASDAYFSTERASGWSLPCMEMLACGRPVGAVDWGGGSEFMNHGNAFLVPAGPLEEVDPRLGGSNPWYRGHRWPAIEIEDVRAAMRSMLEHRDLRSLRARRGQVLVRSAFSSQAIGARIRRALGIDGSFSPMAEGFSEDPQIVVRETPLKVEPGESLMMDLRRIRREKGSRSFTVVGPSQVVSSLLALIQGEPGAEVASAVVSDGADVDGEWSVPVHQSLPSRDQFGDVCVLSRQIEERARSSLLTELSKLGVQVVVEGEAQSSGGVSQSRLRALRELDRLEDEPVALYATGGITAERWRLIEEAKVRVTSIVTPDPSSRIDSWRDHRVLPVEDLVTSPPAAVLLVDQASTSQRRSLETLDMCVPEVPRVRLPDEAPRSRVVDREGLFQATVFRNWHAFEESALHQLTYFPAFRSRAALNEELCRLSCLLPAAAKVRVRVFTDFSQGSGETPIFPLCPPFHMDQEAPRHLDFVEIESIETLQLDHPTDLGAVVVWSTDGLDDADYALLDSADDILLIDVNDHHMRSGFSAAYMRHFCMGRKEILERRERSRALLEAKTSPTEKVYIFGTGPSLHRAFDFDFSDGTSIICNTIVKNEELVRHIKPALIMAADADFHYGPSAYAACFRRDLLAAMELTGAILVCPEVHAAIMEEKHPQIRGRVVGVPIVGDRINLDLRERFWCAALDNVLIQLLLPLATTLGSCVYLTGFDGKKPGDEKFWKHSNIAQYDAELMATVERCHPAFFFYRDYQDYFDRHCRLIEATVEQGEAQGCSYHSLTPSVVPALTERTSLSGVSRAR